MKEIKNDIIKKYKYKDYYIYIQESENMYESYLQKQNNGIISFMFGVNKRNNDLEDFIYLVEVNVEDYIDSYELDYEDWKGAR